LEVKSELKKYSSLGKKVYLMHGNRDFLLGKKFCEEIGGFLLDDPTIIKIKNFEITLMHGDSLCTDDLDYQSFRTVVRDEKWQIDFLEKEISERIELAQNLREVSKIENKDKDHQIMDVNIMAVNEIFQKFKNNILIHGHTHRPKIHKEKYGTRYVLGDWEKQYYFLKIDESIEFINEKIE
jgi:UDP-2,3-diacylglucosamine hydrolase